MSSHHFVREDQEPALLIIDANAVPFETVQELLEWSPTVIVAEQALSQVLLWGIKIDVVIAITEHLQQLASELRDQFPLKLLSCNTAEEALSTGLYFLMAAKQKAVNILSTEPLEFFESFSSIDLTVFRSGSRWSFIRSGKYEKWLPTGRTLRIYPDGKRATLITGKEEIVTIQRDYGFWIAEE